MFQFKNTFKMKRRRVAIEEEISLLQILSHDVLKHNDDDELEIDFFAIFCGERASELAQELKVKRERHYLRQPQEKNPWNSVLWKSYLSADCDHHQGLSGAAFLQFRSLFRVPWSCFNWLVQFSCDYFPVCSSVISPV